MSTKDARMFTFANLLLTIFDFNSVSCASDIYTVRVLNISFDIIAWTVTIV